MNFKRNIFFAILAILISTNAFSQSNISSHKMDIHIPEIALLGLVTNGSTHINLQSNSAVEAGNAIDFTNNKQSEDLWINYSSIIKNTNHRRKIVAFIQGELPAGVQLKVEASEATGSGKGSLGSSVGSVALTNQPTEVITNIGSCYTGKGSSNGHFLSYKLEYDGSSDNYAQLAQAETSFSIVYTLTDLN